MRSSWKGNFFKKNNTLDNSSTLFNTFFKKKFYVYTGKEKKQIFIDKEMVGLKIGQFILTRKMGAIHKKKEKLKRSKK